MRSPVQSRVPLLDKNKAFERLPLLGAFFFSAPVCASVKYNVTWFYKFYRVSLSRKIYKVLFISLLYIQSNTFICQSDVFIHRTFTYG